MIPEPEPAALDLSADWNEIPLLATHLGPSAFHRCHLHPEIKAVRRQALRRVTDGLDALLLPAGYTRTKLVWSKGPVGEPARPVVRRPSAPGTGRGGTLSRLLGRGTAGSDRPEGIRVPVLAGWANDGAVALRLQRSSHGGGFYVNVEVRNAGRYPSGGSGAGMGTGTRLYRGQDFLPDVPRNYRVDMYYYVRLVEDRRYLDFLHNLVEDRIQVLLEAYADPATPARLLPLPREVAERRPLRLPDLERRRLFEFRPTQEQYERYAASASFFSFALRDGRAFQGAIKAVADGRFLLSWAAPKAAPNPVLGGGRPAPQPPDEWVPFDLIDPGSLSYLVGDVGPVVVDLSVDVDAD